MNATLANGNILLKAGMIVFLLVSVIGVVSPLPMTESGFEEVTQVMEVPETRESSGNANLEMMMFVQTASDDGGFYYVCRKGTDTIAYFGLSEVHYVVNDVYFTLEFPGCNQVIPEGEKPTGSVTNYFYGSDSSEWKTGLLDTAELRYRELYPGIDLVYKICNGFIKYDFVVSPGADPGLIRLKYSNADSLSVEGDSVFVSRDGNMLGDTGLYVFQPIDSNEHAVSSAFKSESSNEVVFDLGEYDATETLVIDPVNMPFSTYIGGSANDNCKNIKIENGYLYIAGRTYSSNFPASNGYDDTLTGSSDCFVLKMTADGQSLIYSTFLGGTDTEETGGIDVEDGYVYIAGSTFSSNFPTFNAYDETYAGGSDGFLTKLAQNGASLVYSTYGPVGGTGDDIMMSVAVEDGCAYVTGFIYNGPTWLFDAFTVKLYPNGTTIAYSQILRSTSPSATNDYGLDIAVEDGYAYVSGGTFSSNFMIVSAFDGTHNGNRDAFISKIGLAGGLLYSSYYGTSGDDYGTAIAVEDGYAYVACAINGADYSNVIKVAQNGQSLIYTRSLQGSGLDQIYDIAVERGMAYVVGGTQSANFPMENAYNSTYGGGTYDGFVVSLTTAGTIISYSTFIGGADRDICTGVAVENGYVYVSGETLSTNFPSVNAYNATYGGGYDCFVASFYLDSDSDSLSDVHEIVIGTDPFKIDSDNDNFLDAYEVAYGSDPTDPMSYPAIPQAWYDEIYDDLDGNATLIQNLIYWSDGNSSLLLNVIQQLDDNATLVQQVISWLDGNHTAIETLFTYVGGNASLLLDAVYYLDANATRLEAVAALVTGNSDLISLLDTSVTGDINEIRAIIDLLGASVGDLDYDGLDDLEEIALGTDVDCIDTDCDNLNDAFEVKIGTDPLDDDSDGDSYLDGLEVIAGTNPLDALDYPGSSTPPDNTLLIGLILVGGGGVGVAVVIVFLMKRRKAT